MDDLKAVLFDTFGSVVDWRSGVIEALEEFGAERGIAGDWLAFADAWRGEYRPSMDRVRRGEVAWATLDALHRESLGRLLARHGIEGHDDAGVERLVHAWHRLRPWPDSVPGLTRLKTRYIIGPLSNGNVALLVDMAKSAGLPWDVVPGSDVFRRYKPDPEFYLGACALLGLRPDQVMLAAAHNSDLAAARALGLRTGFFARPLEHGPGQTTDLAAEGEWDVVAGDIEDLARRLGV